MLKIYLLFSTLLTSAVGMTNIFKHELLGSEALGQMKVQQLLLPQTSKGCPVSAGHGLGRLSEASPLLRQEDSQTQAINIIYDQILFKCPCEKG